MNWNTHSPPARTKAAQAAADKIIAEHLAMPDSVLATLLALAESPLGYSKSRVAAGALTFERVHQLELSMTDSQHAVFRYFLILITEQACAPHLQMHADDVEKQDQISRRALISPSLKVRALAYIMASKTSRWRQPETSPT